MGESIFSSFGSSVHINEPFFFFEQGTYLLVWSFGFLKKAQPNQYSPQLCTYEGDGKKTDEKMSGSVD